jgi:hypothetical protein
MKNLQFTTIAAAKKQTGLSYLGSINSSAKIVKNEKFNVNTYIIYLAPASMSGYNVCAGASPECIASCLNFSGHNKIGKLDENNLSKIDKSRIKKTKLFFENREFFTLWAIAEIQYYYVKSLNMGFDFSVRFNGTSDINIETVKVNNGCNLLQIFPQIQFYDYTKIYNRLNLKNKYSNYHLTYSYSGRNMVECLEALSNGHNVAIPFNEYLPDTFAGYPVLNADISDLRYLDAAGHVAGLKFKKVRNKTVNENNVFVINPNHKFFNA